MSGPLSALYGDEFPNNPLIKVEQTSWLNAQEQEVGTQAVAQPPTGGETSSVRGVPPPDHRLGLSLRLEVAQQGAGAGAPDRGAVSA